MKQLIKALLLLIIISSQGYASDARDSEEINAKIEKAEARIRDLVKASAEGAQLNTLYGREALVITGSLATYFLSKKIGLNKASAAGATTIFATAAEGINIWINTDVLISQINQKKLEVARLKVLLGRINTESSNMRSSKVREDLKQTNKRTSTQILELQNEIHDLDTLRENAAHYSADLNKKFIGIGAALSSILVSRGAGWSKAATLASVFASATAAQGFLVFLDTRIYENALAEMRAELMELRSQAIVK